MTCEVNSVFLVVTLVFLISIREGYSVSCKLHSNCMAKTRRFQVQVVVYEIERPHSRQRTTNHEILDKWHYKD